MAHGKENPGIVILDSPPLLAVTDAAVLAPKVDGVILIVAAKQTSYEAASRACEALHCVGANLLGVVLVKTEAEDRRTIITLRGQSQPSI